MQILGPNPRSTESETPGVGPVFFEAVFFEALQVILVHTQV